MVARRGESKSKRPPATTPEWRENQMIAAAIDLAEQQIRDGTASSQVITHYLKLGTSRERLEQKRLEHENALLQAKAEAYAAGSRTEEMLERALKAFKSYSGQAEEDELEE